MEAAASAVGAVSVVVAVTTVLVVVAGVTVRDVVDDGTTDVVVDCPVVGDTVAALVVVVTTLAVDASGVLDTAVVVVASVVVVATGGSGSAATTRTSGLRSEVRVSASAESASNGVVSASAAVPVVTVPDGLSLGSSHNAHATTGTIRALLHFFIEHLIRRVRPSAQKRAHY